MGGGGGGWWCIWFRHGATRREVPVSIPSGILADFQLTESFCPHSAALGSTKPQTEMSNKELPWGKVRQTRRAERKSKDGSPIFHPPTEFPWLVTEGFTLRSFIIKNRVFFFVTVGSCHHLTPW
jgi:hypothetical protein